MLAQRPRNAEREGLAGKEVPVKPVLLRQPTERPKLVLARAGVVPRTSRHQVQALIPCQAALELRRKAAAQQRVALGGAAVRRCACGPTQFPFAPLGLVRSVRGHSGAAITGLRWK